MNNKKTNFKVVLNSYDTASWTGPSKFNATYYLDLKRILYKDAYYDKSYNLTFQLSTTSNSVITNSKIYSPFYSSTNITYSLSVNVPSIQTNIVRVG
jgi:hypothetical protein